MTDTTPSSSAGGERLLFGLASLESTIYLTITQDGHVIPGDGLTMDDAAEKFLLACSEHVARLTAERDAWEAVAHDLTERLETSETALARERERTAALELKLAQLADWVCETGGWRQFYYSSAPPEGVFDLRDQINPSLDSRLESVLDAARQPAPGRGGRVG